MRSRISKEQIQMFKETRTMSPQIANLTLIASKLTFRQIDVPVNYFSGNRLQLCGNRLKLFRTLFIKCMSFLMCHVILP